jgi:hypothetical protein
MRSRIVTSCAVMALVAAVAPVARAADPTTADCLAASDASLKAGNDHKARAERAQLLVCAAASCPADIRKECARRFEERNALIPSIIFQAKDGAGQDISAVKVTMDGEVIAGELEGTSVAVDPGKHTFVFESAGQPTLTEHLVITEGEKDRRERIVFGAARSLTVAPTPTTASGAPTSAHTSMPTPPDSNAPSSGSGLGTQKSLAIVAGGIGLVGLGVGSAFGIISMGKHSDAKQLCPSQCTDDAGVSAWKDAVSAGNVSTALFIVGGVGLAGAVALWFTAPSSSGASSPQVGVGLGSVTVKGTW